MLLKLCDLLNTLFQSFLFVWVAENIALNANQNSKPKSAALLALIVTDVVLFTYSPLNPPLANFLMMIVILLLMMLFYRKYILDGLIGFGLAYFLITVTSYFTVTFYQYYISKLNLAISQEIGTFIFIYIPIFLSYPVMYILRKYIFNVGIFFKSLKHPMLIIQLIVYLLIFINTVYMDWATEEMSTMFKAVLYAVAFITFVFAAVHFAKINDKSQEIEALNIALTDKITELKKIKHDYGSEISALYGLYQLDKIDRLGELLKGIVERYQTVSTAVNVNMPSNPLVASVLNTAVSKGINVVIFDTGEYANLAISENELLRVISNIVRNSVEVLENHNNPVIKYKTYSSYDGITIIINNNGPEIPSDMKSRIFETGFSTKGNENVDRGYGLSIVKDIIGRCSGKISVESNKQWTQFTIEIPYKASKVLDLKEEKRRECI